MESSGRLVILLVAGVIVAFAAIAIKNRMSSAPAGGDNRVIVARQDISPGSIVQAPQNIDWAEAPDDLPNKDELLREGQVKLEEFHGAVARRQLRAGEFIPQSALTKASEGGFMAAVLEPGMRAVSIAVNATSGNAGFISPGDRVDLIVTHRIKKMDSRESSGADAVVSETFVRDVRVLAVDQMLDNPENIAILAKTVTVEVSSRQAEQISVATEMGKISMALRSQGSIQARKPASSSGEGEAGGLTDLYGNSTAGSNPDEYTRDSDVSQVLDRKYVVPRVRIIRGDQIENAEFY